MTSIGYKNTESMMAQGFSSELMVALFGKVPDGRRVVPQ
jgi:hypothetical protein